MTFKLSRVPKFDARDIGENLTIITNATADWKGSATDLEIARHALFVDAKPQPGPAAAGASLADPGFVGIL